MTTNATSLLSPEAILPQPDAPIVQMPLDILFAQIFARLLAQKIGPLMLVCRRWCQIFEQDDTFRSIFRYQFPSVDEQVIEKLINSSFVKGGRSAAPEKTNSSANPTLKGQDCASSMPFKEFYRFYSNVANGVYSSITFQEYEGSEEELDEYDGQNCSIALAGQKLFSCSEEMAIKVWDIKEKKCIATFKGHTDSVNSLAVAGQTLFSGSDDGTIKRWDIETGKCIANFIDLNDKVSCLAVAGQTLFLGLYGGTIKALDINTGRCIATFKGHKGSVYSIALDGQTLFSGSRDNTIKAWDIETRECNVTFQGHRNSVTSLAVAGQTLFSGSCDTNIKVWNIKTGDCIATFQGHKNTVDSLALVGPILFSASKDNTIKAWNIETGECIANVQVSEDEEPALSLALAGQTLFLGSNMNTETTIKFWDYTADYSTVFQQIAQLLKTGEKEAVQRARERLSHMPNRARREIAEIANENLNLGREMLAIVNRNNVVEPVSNVIEHNKRSQVMAYDNKYFFGTAFQIAEAIHEYLFEVALPHASSSRFSANGKRAYDTVFEKDGSTKQ